METTRFTVEQTYDLMGRDGILVAGRLPRGTVRGGQTLLVQPTDTPIHVLGVEFLTPNQRDSDRRTIRISRTDAAKIVPGTILMSPAR